MSARSWAVALIGLALTAPVASALATAANNECSSPQECVFNGFRHCSLGAATLAIDGAGNLVVSNIGSSGDDGLQVVLPHVAGFHMSWLALDPNGTVPDGAHLDLSATGALAGGQDQSLGSARVTDVGSQLELTVDFSPVAATTQHIEVLKAGVLQSPIVTGHTGIVATVERWPLSGGKLTSGPGQPSCYTEDYDPNQPFAIVGGPTLTGDVINILAENQPIPTRTLSGFLVKAKDIPRITVVAETWTPWRSPIPTLSEWGLLVVSTLLLGVGLLLLRRRRIPPDLI